MSYVKETVDRLLKGYDIRLRPDFGGNASFFFFFSTCNPYLVLLSCRRYMSKKLGEACHFHKRALRPMLWPNTRARTHTHIHTHAGPLGSGG